MDLMWMTTGPCQLCGARVDLDLAEKHKQWHIKHDGIEAVETVMVELEAKRLLATVDEDSKEVG